MSQQIRSRFGRSVVTWVAASMMVAGAMVIASTASAAETEVAQASPADAQAATGAATAECPPLTKIKYPFLSCMQDEYGQIVLTGPAQVLVTNHMPPMDPFVESSRYIGN